MYPFNGVIGDQECQVGKRETGGESKHPITSNPAHLLFMLITEQKKSLLQQPAQR